jgi:2-polyprenyl-6-methoxyphenol hydroxylase-like FAD-dependent oxidoreductase
MGDSADVVIVGGGIAGASLAYALASAGLGVTVLESSRQYPDRVRGESMHAWGLKEARHLGVEDVLIDKGAHIAPVWKQYVEGVGEAATFPMSMMVEGIPGTLNMRHPDACQALVDLAASAGATVVRGVQDVKLGPVDRCPSPARPRAPLSSLRRWSWVPMDAPRPSAARQVSPSSTRSRSTTSPGFWSTDSTVFPTTTTS